MMGVFVALYRGINVGGKNVVKMEALRGMHEGLGHGAVRHYIQSGNVVFSGRGTAEGIERAVGAAFLKTFGFGARVLVVDIKEWGEMVVGNPFARVAAGDHKVVHVGICAGVPGEEGLRGFLKKCGGKEEMEVRGRVVYLHVPEGFGKSKFAAGMERASGVAMTVRNWRTVEAVWEMGRVN